MNIPKKTTFLNRLDNSRDCNNINNIEEYTNCKKNEINYKLDSIKLFILKKRKLLKEHIEKKIINIVEEKCIGENPKELENLKVDAIKQVIEEGLPFQDLVLRQFIEKNYYNYEKYYLNEFDEDINKKRERILKDLHEIKEVVKALKKYFNVIENNSNPLSQDNTFLIREQLKNICSERKRPNPELVQIIKNKHIEEPNNNLPPMGLPLPPSIEKENMISDPIEMPNNFNTTKPPVPPEPHKKSLKPEDIRKRNIRNTLFGEKLSENIAKSVDELLIQLKKLHDKQVFMTWSGISTLITSWILNDSYIDEINNLMETKKYTSKQARNKILNKYERKIGISKNYIKRQIENYIEQSDKFHTKKYKSTFGGNYTKKYSKGKNTTRKFKIRKKKLYKLKEKKTRKK